MSCFYIMAFRWIICWYCRTSLLHEKAETFFSHTESTFFVRHSSEYETSYIRAFGPPIGIGYNAFTIASKSLLLKRRNVRYTKFPVWVTEAFLLHVWGDANEGLNASSIVWKFNKLLLICLIKIHIPTMYKQIKRKWMKRMRY